jgi:hypothetical protein
MTCHCVLIAEGIIHHVVAIKQHCYTDRLNDLDLRVTAFLRMLTSLKHLVKQRQKNKVRVISSCSLLRQLLPPHLGTTLSSMLGDKDGGNSVGLLQTIRYIL